MYSLHQRTDLLQKMSGHKTRKHSSPVRVLADVARSIPPLSHGSPSRNDSPQCEVLPSYNIRGLPWGALKEVDDKTNRNVVNDFLEDQRIRQYPKSRNDSVPPTNAEFKALCKEAKLVEGRLSASYEELETALREMEQAAINEHVIQLGMNEAGTRLDFFVQADETQLSCTNALRHETLLKQERPERIKALNRSYANFRWNHRKEISTDRFEVAKHIGKALPINLQEVKFLTTETFNLLEVFKTRLHSGHFHSDENLSLFLSVIKTVHKNEKKRLEQIRKRNELTRGGHWFIKRRRWKPRNGAGYSRAGLVGYPFRRNNEVWDAVDFALRGCDPMLCQNLKKILKRNQRSRSSIRKRMEAILRLQKGDYSSRRNISEATKVCQFAQIRVNSTTPVPEPSIICNICDKQKAISVDENVIPPFWVAFLTRVGHFCGHPKCVKRKVKVLPEIKKGSSRKKSSAKAPSLTLPFVQYEKLHRVAKKALQQRVVKGQSNVLEDHNIGIRGRTILTPQERNDPLGQPAAKTAMPIEDTKENNVAPEGFLVNKRITF